MVPSENPLLDNLRIEPTPGRDDARHLRRLGRSDAPQAAAGGLQPVARPASAGPVRRHRRGAQRDERRAVPPAVPRQPARVREGRRAQRRGRAVAAGADVLRVRRDGRSRPVRATRRASDARSARRGCSTTSPFRPASTAPSSKALGRRRAGRHAGDRLAAADRREAVRHRPRQRAEPERAAAPPLHGRADLPHRSLPRQGDRPEPAGAALRQRDVRADLEPALHRSRADHRGRDRRRRTARVVLRGGRRAARHGAEPPDAAAGARRDGAADGVHRRQRPRSQDGRAARRAADCRQRRRTRRRSSGRSIAKGG